VPAPVEALVEHYRDIGIDVVNSTGDQFSLLCESLPATGAAFLLCAAPAAVHHRRGVPTATVDLGTGRWRAGQRRRLDGSLHRRDAGPARSIVHFDPLLRRPQPATAVAITGEPGGGKTTLALLMIMQLALRGVTVAVIDPKGTPSRWWACWRPRPQGPVLPLGSAAPASRPVLVRRRLARSGPWPPRRCGCCCRG